MEQAMPAVGPGSPKGKRWFISRAKEFSATMSPERWKEDQDLDGDTFTWTHFVLAGDPSLERADAQGNIRGDTFGSPDGLRIDPRGVLWIQTDVSTSTLGKGDYVHLSNNQMLACDPTQGTIRRFLVGPRGCELTGIAFAPDLRTATFKGRETIRVRLTQPATAITLHAAEITFVSVSISAGGQTQAARVTLDAGRVTGASFQFVRHNAHNETVPCKIADEKHTLADIQQRSESFGATLTARGDDVEIALDPGAN